MKKIEANEEESDIERVISENIENVTIFPCLLVIPKVLDDEEFINYLKKTKKRSVDSDTKTFKRDSYES